jgi:hypothetical protein
MIRNWLAGLNWLTGLLAAVGLSGITATVAQAYEVSLPVLAQVPLLAQVKVTQTGGKNFVVESLVVVVLFGVALFVVCKTSRRS